MKKIKTIMMCMFILMTNIVLAFDMPLEIIDLDKLDSPNQMTEGLLPTVYYGILNFFSNSYKYFLILIVAIAIAIIIVLSAMLILRIVHEVM